MKRYTFFTDDYPVVTCNHCYEDQNENYTGPAIDRLAEYESTGLMPAEVAALQYQLKHVRSTLDAVEVVRCKDCKHWLPYPSLGINDCGLHKGLVLTNADTYCPYGERKGNGTELLR